MPTPPHPILLFGGTFDPPHRAHTTLPPLVAAHLGCPRIVYVPAAVSPHKVEDPPSAAEDRVAMLRLALRDVPGAEVSTIELDRAGPSFFVDTVDALAVTLGTSARLHFLIGADQALAFHRWRSWERILERATPAVVLRPPWDERSFENALGRRYDDDEVRAWMSRIAPAPLLDVSASDLRRRLAAGEDVADDMDPAVVAYVHEHGLYGAGTTA